MYRKNTRIVGKQRSNTRLQVERQQRRQRALELRMAGASYQQIVQANIGYNSVGHVGSDMKNILESVRLESPENLILLDLARLDDLQQVLTLHFHRGDVGLSSAIMQVMKFRHSLLGIDEESIRQRNLERTQVTNNGIMVVQGNTRDYLASMMEAAGLSPEQQDKELRRLESAEGERKELPAGSNSGRVIQGEVIPEVISSETPSDKSKRKPKENPSSKGQTKSIRKVKLKVPGKKLEKPLDAPKATAKPLGATQTRSKSRPGTLSPKDTERPLEDRLEAFSAALDAEQQEQEAAELPVARLADAVVTVDLENPEVRETLRKTIRGRVLERDIKTPDNNVPVSPGVPYKAAPRKLSPAEGRALVLRKLGRPGGTSGRLVDRVPVETSQEEIP